MPGNQGHSGKAQWGEINWGGSYAEAIALYAGKQVKGDGENK